MKVRICFSLLGLVLLAGCPGSRAGFHGTWESSRAAVGEGAILTTLRVDPGGTAEITSSSEGTVPVVMKGSWEQSGEHRMTARFTERSTPPLDAPLSMTFQLKSGELVVIDGPGAGLMAPFRRR